LFWNFVAIAVLIALNGFFVAVEFAAVTSRRARLTMIAEPGSRPVRIVEKWLDDPSARDRLIAASQLGITIVSLMLGAIGENTFEELLGPYFHNIMLPEYLQILQSVIAALPLVLSLIIVTSFHVVLGEQVPKIAALHGPERFALLSAQPMQLFMSIFRGFINVLDWATRVILRLFGIHAQTTHGNVYTLEELQQIVSGPETEGIIQEPQREMLSAVFEFGKRVVRQVMIPRTEVTAMEASTPLSEALNIARENQYTKFPVYAKNLDQIIGILHTKDLLNTLENPENINQPARSIVRNALFVPESISVNALLHQFRDHQQHIAIALDEYGGTSGLVTLEDLLEEIIGEIRDPFDADQPEIQFQQDGIVLIDGLAQIEYVNQQVDLHLVDDEHDTIAGFFMDRLDRIPTINDEIILREEGVRLKVKTMDQRRIAQLELTRIKS
jgi:putative hemolysin